MSAAAWARVILLLLEGVRNLVTWQREEQHRENVERIKTDPVAEWNRRMGGVRNDDASVDRVPARSTNFTNGVRRGGVFDPHRPDEVADVFRESGDAVQVNTNDETDRGSGDFSSTKENK